MTWTHKVIGLVVVATRLGCNMEQLIYELSFFGMIVILIGLRLWGDSK